MVGIGRIIGGAVTAIVLFGLGMMFQSWRADQQLKVNSCDVRRWFPNEGTFRVVNTELSDCLPLGPEISVSGIWTDDPYKGGFTPDSKKSGLPADMDLYMDQLTRVQTHWLAGLRKPPEFFSGRRYRVTVTGRMGHRQGLVLDGHNNVLVVSGVKQIRLLVDEET